MWKMQNPKQPDNDRQRERKLVERVLSGDSDATAGYLKLLASGGSDYPIELLKQVGVDMTTPQPLEATLDRMNVIMDEIEKIAPV